MKRLMLGLVLLVAGCGELPRDVEGTIERVSGGRLVRVGIIAGPSLDPRRQQLFLDAVQRRSGARPEVTIDATEPLLGQLERGELDLVIGPMSKSSGWRRQVHFMPLRQELGPAGDLELVTMARNGENRWIALLHREARRVAEQ